LVDSVPMPPIVRSAFEVCVAEDYAERPFYKRQRDRADPEALAGAILRLSSEPALGLAPLCATSFNGAIRKLGSRTWNRLHSAIYVLTGLAVLHFLMSPGSVQGLPFTMAGAYFWLMAWRLLDRNGLGTDWRILILLALSASFFTLFLEPFWLATFQAERSYYPPLQALAANFTTENWDMLGVPPVWQILAVGLLAALPPMLRAFVLAGGLGANTRV
jgi:sulfoxide reductase heme-binding subunit YedZ